MILQPSCFVVYLEAYLLTGTFFHIVCYNIHVPVLIQCEESPRDHGIITIILNCALRLSELASLDIDQVDNEVISVVGKGNKERRIYLTPAAKKSINKWIQNVVKKYIIASGLDPESISTHKLRHTSATLMYKYGRVDIRSLQQILGHESVATTEIYTHIDEHQLQSAVNSNYGLKN